MFYAGFWSTNHADHVFIIYSGVLFCDGLFYDGSLLQPLSSQTKHSRMFWVASNLFIMHRRS
jgi:hypothetical protein